MYINSLCRVELYKAVHPNASHTHIASLQSWHRMMSREQPPPPPPLPFIKTQIVQHVQNDKSHLWAILLDDSGEEEEEEEEKLSQKEDCEAIVCLSLLLQCVFIHFLKRG